MYNIEIRELKGVFHGPRFVKLSGCRILDVRGSVWHMDSDKFPAAV